MEQGYDEEDEVRVQELKRMYRLIFSILRYKNRNGYLGLWVVPCICAFSLLVYLRVALWLSCTNCHGLCHRLHHGQAWIRANGIWRYCDESGEGRHES